MPRLRWLPIALVLLFGCTAPVQAPSPAPTASPAMASPYGPLPENHGEVSTLVPSELQLTAFALRDDDLYLSRGGKVTRHSLSALRRTGSLDAGLTVMSKAGGYSYCAIAPTAQGVWAVRGDGSVEFAGSDGQSSETRKDLVGFLNWAIAADADGNAYVPVNLPDYRAAGGDNNYIARITPDGEVSTFAGLPSVEGGYRDGEATTAEFRGPGALAFDGVGNLYVSDLGNYAIRRIDRAGQVTTVAGHGRPAFPPSPMPGQPSPDLSPLFEGTVVASGMTLNRDGTLYFTGSNHRVYRLTADGTLSVFAGEGKACRGLVLCTEICPSPETDRCDRDGPAMTARFFKPTAIAADRDGALYVLDEDTASSGKRLRMIR